MSGPTGERLFVYGMNHATADLDTRESFALDAPAREEARRQLAERLDLTRAVLLSTCNRTELYGFVSEETAARDDLEAELRFVLFPGLDPRIRPYLLSHRAPVFHLFRVSAGLDSMIVGETEILGQVKAAFEEAKSAGESDRVLHDLFRQAIQVGKRVRTETQVGEGSVSVASTAVKLAAKVVGQLEDKTVVIVGAGATGELTARHVRAAGATRLHVVNRTVERARELTDELGGVAGGLDELPALLEGTDVLFACVEASEPTVTQEMVKGLDPRTRCFVDISVPRGIDPGVADQTGLFLMDIDDLARLVDATKEERRSHIDAAEDIIVGEVHKFLALQSFADMSPLVRRLRASFDETVEGFVASDLDGAGEEVVRKLTSRLLAAALDDLKTSTRWQHSEEEIRAAYRRYVDGLGGNE